MRIISGSRKSLRLLTPKGMNTRPTMDRTKETLFNIIGTDIYGCRFLDLYSGSGSIGLEALSRDAESSVLVEKNRESALCIRQNIKLAGFESQARLMNMDVKKAVDLLSKEQAEFDIIFMDPPFGKSLEMSTVLNLKKSTLMHRDTLIIIETSEGTDLRLLNDMELYIAKEKSYKTHKHIFVRNLLKEDVKGVY